MKHSRLNLHIQEKIYLVVPLLALSFLVNVVAAQQGRPEVIDYYWSRASAVWLKNQKALSDQLVSCDVSAVVQELSRGGVVKSADTSINRYFYTNGRIDSIVNVSGTKRLSVDIDLNFPTIFDSNYQKTFFPNDTGAGDLAIGFDTDTLVDPRPTGILTIDRNTYAVRRLHISWPHKDGYRRFGRSYVFALHDGHVLIDSMVESAVIERLFKDEDYRLEIVLSNYRFNNPVDSISR